MTESVRMASKRGDLTGKTEEQLRKVLRPLVCPDCKIQGPGSCPLFYLADVQYLLSLLLSFELTCPSHWPALGRPPPRSIGRLH